MNRSRLPLLAPVLIVLIFNYCSGNSTIANADEVEVQPGEVSVAQPAPPQSATPTTATTGPAQDTQVGTQPPAPASSDTAPQPVLQPTQPASPPSQSDTTPLPATPCGLNRAELLAGTWGLPDTQVNVASEAAVVHGDFVTSVGSGMCGPLLETRTRTGVLVRRNYLPRDLMDYHTGIAKFPRGGYVLAGMRTAVQADLPGWAIQRMVIALVDENAQVIWKNDFAPEGPSLQNWGYAVITDKEGNSYVAANLNGFSVVKISPAGARIWTYNYAENSGTARAIRFDAEGNVVATGYIDVNLQSELGDRDVFVIKLSPKKKILWRHRVVSPTLDYAYDLAINKAGQTWIYGWSFDQGVTFRKKTLRLPSTFLIRLEQNGTRSAIIDPGISGYTARIAVMPDQKLLLSGALISNMPTTPNPLSVALFSADGLLRLGEKSFITPYWNVLNFMTMSPEGEIYVGSSSGTPVGQAPSYAFGSILKLFEADLLPCNNTH